MSDDLFTVNIDRCINDTTRPAVIRNLFVMLRDRGYVTPGEFFETLHDSDLNVLREMTEIVAQCKGDVPKTVEQEEAFSNLVLFTLGLIVAEGGDANDDSLSDSVKIAMGFITLENLARLGFIDVYRENWSMDPDHKGPIAAARKLND